MKNTLAENLLRFGVKNLSENEIQKLQEQETPKLTGNAAAALISIPGIQVSTATQGQGAGIPTLNTENLTRTLITYLGGERSFLNGIINKNVLIFSSPVNKLAYQKGRDSSIGVQIENGDTSKLIPYVIQPKAWYVGYPTDPSNKVSYIYLFDKPINTNYSGDPNLPWIGKNGQPTNDWNAAKTGADLLVKPNSTGAPAYQDNPGQTLGINPAHVGKNFNVYKIRTYDGMVLLNNNTQTAIGYADYIPTLGYKLGTMQGVTKL